MSLRTRLAPTPPRADLNLTPMIDVMLVLLMIFMIVVPVLASMVDLPVASYSDSRPEEPDEIVLTIHRNLTYALEASGVSRPSDARRLEAELGQLYRNRTRDRILYLKADSILPFDAVEQAMRIARRSGVRVVATVTQQRGQPRQ